VDDVEHHAMRTRRAFLASVSVASALATRPGASFAESVAVDASDALGAQLASARATRVSSAAASSSLATGSSARAMRIPMRLDRAGTYVVEYRIGGTTVRGVLDTGSPFITMESACGQVWGCLREEDARRSGLEDTYEVYGLQEDGVTRWVLGDVTFAGKEATKDETNETATSDARQRLGSFVGDASNDSNDGNLDAVSAADAAADAASVVSFAFPELSFGVTSQTTGRAGSAAGGVGSAPFVGLVKQRADWIRPTFLEQTDVASFALDFEKDELLLSRDDLIPRGVSRNVFPLVDLRPMGAPVFHYAVKVEELWINGGRYRGRDVPLKPIYAVFDSGVTGALVSRELFYDSDFEFGTFECHARIKSEDGARVSVGTSLRTCTGRCLFLALPVEVPWVGFEDAHVIFLGLAFMYGQGGITVDADAKRIALGAFGPTH
jgi:hypothetical protein